MHILFKKMNQNFQLHYFNVLNVNARYTQALCTLIAQILMTVLQKMAFGKKAFSAVASLIRIHLVSMLDVFELPQTSKRHFSIKDHPPNPVIEMELELKWGGGNS